MDNPTKFFIERKHYTTQEAAPQPPEHVSGLLTTLLLRHLSLLPKHKAMLRARGLGDEWIEQKTYRSTPRTQAERDAIAAALAPYLDAFGGNTPGFYHDGSRWRMVYCASGFFISARDEFGHIRALAYRLDEPRDGMKYVWLSSNPEAEDDHGRQKYPRGLSSGAPPHFANRLQLWSAEELTIVEGTLKADVCAALSGLPVVGIAGVNNIRGVAARLRANFPRLRRVYVAFDKDVLEKPQVAGALERLIVQLEGERFRVRVRMWPGPGKGFDDFLLSQISAQEVAA